MPFRTWNILLISDAGKTNRTFRVHPLFIPIVILVFLVLIAGNIILFRYSQHFAQGTQELARNNSIIAKQHDKLISMSFNYVNVERHLKKIKNFNMKLSIMLSMHESEGFKDIDVGGFEPYSSPLFNTGTGFQKDLIRQLHDKYAFLNSEMMYEEYYQQILSKAILDQKDLLTKIPSIWPVAGRLSSNFGYRRSPFTGVREFHKGIDVSARSGTPIWAPAGAVVVFAGRFSSYGISILLEHPDTGMKTRYAHLRKLNVKVGDKVARGDIIGFIGNTGRSKAPHLHYEVHKDGKLANPLYYIMN